MFRKVAKNVVGTAAWIWVLWNAIRGIAALFADIVSYFMAREKARRI